MSFAPIALFIFKRAEHLRNTLESLAQCPELERTPVFVFADGPRNEHEAPAVREARRVAREALAGCNVTFVESERNRGLAQSIISGVTDLCARFGRVIVVEDDLLLAPDFLRYMNEALERFQGEERVMQISGHMFPVELPCNRDALFLPFSSTWGWATWARAWSKMSTETTDLEQRLGSSAALRKRFDLDGAYPYFRMLRRARENRVDSWGILWYLRVFAAEGLVLYPTRSLVRNAGFDGSGTNCRSGGEMANQFAERGGDVAFRWPERTELNSHAFRAVKLHLGSRSGLMARLLERIKGMVRR